MKARMSVVGRRRSHYDFRIVQLMMIACAIFVCTACNRNPFLAAYPGGAGATGQQFNPNMAAADPAITAQMTELDRRTRLLDDNNRQLTTQLAQSQQQMQLFRERSELLQRQLQDVSTQLDQSRLAQNQASQQVRGLQANMQSRGSAKLVANNSLSRQADRFREMGLNVQIEGDVIRVSIPSDQLFQPGTAQLSSNSAAILDKVAEGITKGFSRQRIAIEGHTDAGEMFGGTYATPHQLAGAQSLSVLEQLVRRNGVPQSQLFCVSHGTNHPLAENQSPVGRAQNRRIDIVVYPDTF
jgi:flagellar motor protein MotB